MFTPLTEEQFNKATKAGFTSDQIIQMEQRRKNESEGTSLTENVIKSADQLSAERFKPTFPSTSDESMLGGAAKVVGNIPSSAIQFGKSLFEFFNPVNTAKTLYQYGKSAVESAKAGENVSAIDVLKEVPTETYKAVVPTFLQNLFAGDTEEAKRTIENDPVGQIAPLIILAKMGAEKAGKGAEFDAAMTKLSKPITKPISMLKGSIGNILAQGSGIATGAGAS